MLMSDFSPAGALVRAVEAAHAKDRQKTAGPQLIATEQTRRTHLVIANMLRRAWLSVLAGERSSHLDATGGKILSD